MLTRTKTQEIYGSLNELIPGGVNSPVRACKAVGQMPLIVSRGQEDMIYDVDGNTYIDYCGSWGALIHGHAHPQITRALKERIERGTSFGITSDVEELLAKKVVGLVPAIEKIRFVSSGTEATMSAVRLARGFTGRDLIIKYSGHYHGHADFFLIKAGSGVLQLNPTSSSMGIPDDFVKHTLCLPFNDMEATRKALRDPKIGARIACVILEPIAGNMGVVPATKEFMQMLRDETVRAGALLILDEVITGFRVAKGGAQSLYGVKPDLTCLGKIVGGGLPAAAFGGRAEVMNCLAPLGSVYQAGTLSGNPLAMEAGLQALSMLEEPNFYAELHRKTDFLIKPIIDFISQNELNACVQSVGSMFTIFFGKRSVKNGEEAKELDYETFGKFFRFLFERGIYIPPLQQEAWFISSAHTLEHLKQTQDCILEFMKSLCD